MLGNVDVVCPALGALVSTCLRHFGLKVSCRLIFVECFLLVVDAARYWFILLVVLLYDHKVDRDRFGFIYYIFKVNLLQFVPVFEKSLNYYVQITRSIDFLDFSYNFGLIVYQNNTSLWW